MSEPPKIVTREETRPCGCHVVEYSDKTGQLVPCPPCGLLDAARNLSAAANAIAAVANRLRIEQNRATSAAVSRIINPT
jgi:hypothetical protein